MTVDDLRTYLVSDDESLEENTISAITLLALILPVVGITKMRKERVDVHEKSMWPNAIYIVSATTISEYDVVLNSYQLFVC